MEILQNILLFFYQTILKMIQILDIKIFGNLSLLDMILGAKIIIILIKIFFEYSTNSIKFDIRQKNNIKNNERKKQISKDKDGNKKTNKQ